MQSYEVRIEKRAEKQLRAVPARDQDKLRIRIASLADNPRPEGCEPIKGAPKGTYRIRQGDYRAVYVVADAIRVVTVVRVGDRKDIYR